ncbi:proline--tRNA ligase [Planctomycetota bacterium]
MRYSRLLVPTLREVPKDAVVASHRLMIRAGMIRQVAAGIYNLLPLGLRVLRKVEQIVREEMERAGAQEILMPAVQPSALWEESGRWGYYGPELLRFHDRNGTPFCFGPTHEEVVTDLVRREARSYRDLPLNLYQIQTKFRDEERPRFGIMRAREFIMKDAYSFDVDEETARKSYWDMYRCYERIFSRCGLRFKAVEAATGAIGGTLSHEFQVLASSGEDAILACNRCDYAANVEKAELVARTAEAPEAPPGDPVLVETPGQRTVEEVTAFLGVSPEDLVKTLLYVVAGRPVAVLARGDHEVSEAKLQGLLEVDEVELATDEIVTAVTGAPVGFAGPVGLSGLVETLADHAVRQMSGFVTGANQADAHFTQVHRGRDFQVDRFADLRRGRGGEACSRCAEGHFEEHRGIEVGQVFYLGTKYAERLGASILTEEGKKRPIVMGCYGIGIGRTAAAAIEQNHDDRGISWPMGLAPYQVVVLPLQMNRSDVVETAERLYAQCEALGLETIIDDRDERAGVKFNDADLIGFPVRVVVGSRGLRDGQAEIQLRSGEPALKVRIDEAPARVKALVAEKETRGIYRLTAATG